MWLYVIASGKLWGELGLAATGYSGNGVGKNNPALQGVQDVGPIPEGRYTITPPVNSVTHGPYAMALRPEPANNMLGRSGFMMHGDSIEHPGSASDGCVIMPRAVREQVWNSGDKLLQVVAS